MVLDFDEIDDWAPSLASVLQNLLPPDLRPLLASRRPEFVEDAVDILFELGKRDTIIDAALDWIRSGTIVGYHGTRLTSEELASVREVGLVPLDPGARRGRLTRALSQHPKWQSVADCLDEMLTAYGPGLRAGRREGQVHLTLSYSSLMNGFNHYLTHGSEFDQRVAHALLGEEGKDLLGKDGTPMVLKLGVPGAVALDAAHPFTGIENVRNRGDVPNIINECLKAWSYSLAYPGFRSSSLLVDCGLFFRKSVPVVLADLR